LFRKYFERKKETSATGRSNLTGFTRFFCAGFYQPFTSILSAGSFRNFQFEFSPS